MVLLDRTNVHLLDLLQKDARMSISDLARVVNRGESTVRERMAALERNGVIRGYRALVDRHRIGFDARALIRADCDLRNLPELAKKLAAIPNVISASVTTGARPLRIEILAEDLTHLQQVLERRLATLDLRRIETNVVINTLVEPRPIPPFAASWANEEGNGAAARPPAVVATEPARPAATPPGQV